MQEMLYSMSLLPFLAFVIWKACRCVIVIAAVVAVSSSSPCHCRHHRRRHCRHRCRVIFLGIRHLKSLSLSHRHCRRRRRVIVVIVVVLVIAAIIAVSSLSSLSPSLSSLPSSSCHCYGGSNIIVAISSSLCCVEAQRQRDTRRKGNNREVALPFGNPYSQQNPQFQNHPVENVLHD
jgi:hypothetical protein